MDTKALTEYEGTTLAENESIIERGQKSFVEVGTALMRIRDGKLYPGAKKRGVGATFEGYCRARWGMASRTAYQLIDAAATVPLVCAIAHTKPSNESQVRPLLKLPEADRAEAWLRAEAKAEENGGAITAKKVREAVEELRGGEKIIPDPPSLIDLVREFDSAMKKILGKCKDRDRAERFLRNAAKSIERKVRSYEND